MAVATPCLQFPHSPTNMALTMKPALNDVALVFRSSFLGTTTSPSKLQRTRSYEYNPKQRYSSSSICTIRRACSASFTNSSDEDFSKKIHDLAFGFHISDEDNNINNNSELNEEENEVEEEVEEEILSAESSSLMEMQSIEMKAKSLDLPLSLRMIGRKKKQLKENLIEVGELAYCSMKKAFSSMVFIIRELHTYSLHMREVLYFEDLQGILARVQSEMHASFVWLFQQVFSHTPTLMVYIMILLANFTVHSMSTSAAIAAPPTQIAAIEERDDVSDRSHFDFDASIVKSFRLTSSSPSSTANKTISVGGNNGGGDNTKPVSSGMDGDGWMNENSGILHRPIVPDGVSPVNTREDTWQEEKEVELWNSIVNEASRMQSEVRDESFDSETMAKFVSPVNAKIEADDYENYFRTDLLYQTAVANQPANVLLLANYAQFLYVVARDFDRAEEYFKKAVNVEPKDAEAHNKYAYFLWHVRKDLWAAEETFLEAISADPSNSYYAASYANFLWNTGGEDTCFPLDSPDDESETLDS
ncbi:Adenosine monophosphate-protein transferase Fic [Bienertia sinuspersici]